MLFDVSSTYGTPYKTGIQRVVEELGIALSELGKADLAVRVEGQSLNYMILTSGEFRMQRESAITAQRIAFITLLKTHILRHRLTSSLVHNSGLFGLYRKLQKFRSQSEISENIRNCKSLNQYSKYFTADSFWNSEADLSRIEHANKLGVEISILVHDVLPFSYPEFFREDSVSMFKKNFGRATSLASRLYFVSKYSKMEFENFFPDCKAQKFVLPLATKKFEPEHFITPSLLPANFRNKPYAVMLGTIEPRKNYDLVLSSFKRNEFPVNLLIIGREGWLSKKTLKLIKSLKHKVLWIDSASDQEVNHYLQKAEFGICASFAEGFGLPLREFTGAGLPVLASDIPPFRENVSEIEIEYFDPHSEDSFGRALKNIRGKRAMMPTKWRSWIDVAKEIQT